MFSQLLRRWQYWLVGPSPGYLKYEIYLLFSMVLLTIGSISGLYHCNAFQLTYGDLSFIGLATLVSSRHLWFRLWSTWTPHTCGCSIFMIPSCIIQHFVQSHLIGGQIMDRPTPSDRPTPNTANHNNSIPGLNNNNNQHYHLSAQDRQSQIVGSAGNQEWCFLDFLPSSVTYSIKMIYGKAAFHLYPFFPSMGATTKDSEKLKEQRRQQHHTSWPMQTLQTVLRKIQHLWIAHGESLQCWLYTFGVLYIIDALHKWGASENIFPSFMRRSPPPPDLTLITLPDDTHNHLLRRPENKNLLGNAIGYYSRRLQPEWYQVWLFLSTAVTTLGSILYFCRFFPPLLDWIASGTVAKDSRIEGWTTYHFHHPKRTTWLRELFLPDTPDACPTAPWCERHQHIAPANRLQLSMQYLFVRVIENVLLFGIVPRMHYSCRFMGRCPPGPTWSEWPCLLYPTGFKKPVRRDCAADLMQSHMVSFWVVLLGVVLISASLLMAQTVVFQRSYLAALAHLKADGWKRIQPPQSILQVFKSVFTTSTSSSTKRQQQQQQKPAVWEPGRKYRVGDVVAFPGVHGALYQATCMAPEGRPPDDHLLLGYDILRSEALGPVSVVVQTMASFQVDFILMGHVACTLGSILRAGVEGNEWLLWVMVAYVTSGFGLLSSVSTPSGNSKQNLDDLHRLNAQFKEKCSKLG